LRRLLRIYQSNSKAKPSTEDSTDTYAMNMDDNHIFNGEAKNNLDENSALSSCISKRPLTATGNFRQVKKTPAGFYQRMANQLYQRGNESNKMYPFSYIQTER